MQERKQVVGVLVIVMLLSWSVLPWIQFGNVLDDKEYDSALLRAQLEGFPDIETTKKYPFSTLTRAEAASRYVSFAKSKWLILTDATASTGCDFKDIADVKEEQQQAIADSCRYGFFKGREGEFRPDQYVSKAESLVALVRGIATGEQFEDTGAIYRTPYVNRAYEHGITKRKSTPYMMYLVTRYELLLELWRAKGK